MKRLMVVVAFLLLAGVGGAQVSMIPKGGGGGGTVTLTSGTTATSGCLDGAPLKSNSNVVTCTKMDLTKFVTADFTTSSASYVDVTDLVFSVAANTTYVFQCSMNTVTAATTTGIQIAFNGPASPTNFRSIGTQTAASTIFGTPYGATYDSTDGVIGTSSLLNNSAVFSGTLENGVNAGSFAVRLRSEVGGSDVTIYRGGWCRVWTP